MDGRCESQQGVSKQMPSSTENIKSKNIITASNNLNYFLQQHQI